MNVSLHSRIHITVRALLIGLAMAAVLCTTTWAASEKVLYRFHGKDGGRPTAWFSGRTARCTAQPCRREGDEEL